MPAHDTNVLSLCSVGDINPRRDEPEKMFDLSKDVLKGFDIRMCQLETNFVGGQPPEHEGDPHIPGDPAQIESLIAGGFDIATMAGNHALFGGRDALIGGLELMSKRGIKVVGAGRNIEEARRPLILERKGMKIAFLNYNSVLKDGDWATEKRAGVAPLRVKTMYEMMEPSQPGTPPRVLTFAEYDDLNAMLDDIKKAKAIADIVVLSMHWGIHFMPVKLATFQKPVAHYAVDAGADIIIGSHPHILKGIEVYKGKVVFYSLGNFAFDSFRTQLGGTLPPHMVERRQSYGVVVDPAWARTYPYSADSRKTMAVKVVMANKKIEKVSFLPGMIQIDARPKILSREEDGFDEVVDYVREITEKAGLNAICRVEGDEVVVLSA